MAERGEDFVYVQLSKAGQEVAAGADGKGLVLGLGGADYHVEFKRGDRPQRILKSLWLRSLSKEVRVVSTEKNPEGVAECLLELSTEKPAVTVPRSVVTDDNDESGPAKK
jgi:hypothetical protein